MADLADEELIERYRAESNSAIGRALIDELFGRHHAQVAVWCYRMTGNVDSAADMAQEVFLKAFQRLDSYRGTSKFTTWLYSIARNHCLDELRSRAVRPKETTDALLDDVADTGSEHALATLVRRESESAARQLMQESLDEIEARIMTLHYVHDLPLDAITRMMGLTNPSGAKAFIVSARRKLSRAVDRWRARGEGAKAGRHES
jgi:RNA polymerase sigma-70 factor (ECF subfamily)